VLDNCREEHESDSGTWTVTYDYEFLDDVENRTSVGRNELAENKTDEPK